MTELMPIPEGKYDVIAVEVTARSIKYKITNGKYKGRHIWAPNIVREIEIAIQEVRSEEERNEVI